MGVFIKFRCTLCSKEITEFRNGLEHTDICDECSVKVAKENRKKHFNELKGLTLEQRMRRVEEWIYNMWS